MVTHLVGLPGFESAVSKDSIAPLVFFSFFTSASTACKENDLKIQLTKIKVSNKSFESINYLLSPLFFLISLLPAQKALDSRGCEGEEGVDTAAHPGHDDALKPLPFACFFYLPDPLLISSFAYPTSLDSRHSFHV